jgi:hypothetical protein
VVGAYACDIVRGEERANHKFCRKRTTRKHWDGCTRILVGPDDIAAQYRQAWGNMLTALRAAGLGPEHLVKTTMFVVGESSLSGMGKSSCFRTHRPPRL